MKSKVLIAQDIFRKLSAEAKKSHLTPDELAEVLIKREMKIK
tara:strand:- start:115 stop:240 length:126 start_codon:yes stop_codon:yes gene_type:complete